MHNIPCYAARQVFDKYITTLHERKTAVAIDDASQEALNGEDLCDEFE